MFFQNWRPPEHASRSSGRGGRAARDALAARSSSLRARTRCSLSSCLRQASRCGRGRKISGDADEDQRRTRRGERERRPRGARDALGDEAAVGARRSGRRRRRSRVLAMTPSALTATVDVLRLARAVGEHVRLRELVGDRVVDVGEAAGARRRGTSRRSRRRAAGARRRELRRAQGDRVDRDLVVDGLLRDLVHRHERRGVLAVRHHDQHAARGDRGGGQLLDADRDGVVERRARTGGRRRGRRGRGERAGVGGERLAPPTPCGRS